MLLMLPLEWLLVLLVRQPVQPAMPWQQRIWLITNLVQLLMQSELFELLHQQIHVMKLDGWSVNGNVSSFPRLFVPLCFWMKIFAIISSGHFSNAEIVGMS